MLQNCICHHIKKLVNPFKKAQYQETGKKLINVTCIYKKGPTCEPRNYRPVSLTSVVCKFLERNIKNESIEHLKRHERLTDSQYELHENSFQMFLKIGQKLLTKANRWILFVLALIKLLTPCLINGN